MEPALCQYLKWDSEFFGLRIARLSSARLTPETVSEAERWCGEEKIDCLYFLSDFDDPVTVRVAQEREFRLTDVRVTLEARVSHRDSRFYFDPRFPEDACDRLYETWIDRSCHGWASAVFVADVGGGAAGYATAHRDSDGEGRLGLLAVDARVHGQGLGGQLGAAVLDWARRENLATVSVVTQGRNCRAMRLYMRCGFLPRSVQLWYHRWFRRAGSGAPHEL